MTRRSTLVPLLAIFAGAACSTDTVAPDSMSAPSLSFSASAASDGSGTYLVRFKGHSVSPDFARRVEALGGEVIFAHAGAGIGAVSGLDDQRAAQLAKVTGVASVDPDAVTLLDRPTSIELSASESPESPSNPTTSVRYNRQWHLRAIEAHTAWAAGKLGDASVKVGIIDTGIDYLFPDTWGRVDLALSKSFLSAAENARVQTAWPGAHEVADLHYHGTHVAATVASNALLVSGVTSRTTLVGLKVCTPGNAPAWQASCPTSGVLNAILYAADNGLNIVNLSLGGTFARRDASAKGGFGPSFIATINQVMHYANRGGVTVVVSAGNDAVDMDNDGNSFKAYCSASSVICVSATGPTTAGTILPSGFYSNLQNVDALAPYSNYGESAVTVAAPGGAAAPVWAPCSGFIIVPGFGVCQTRFYNPVTGAGSGVLLGASGTSMASPHAAGVAALIAAEGVRHPNQVSARLRGTADDLGPAGNDPAYGQGRVNAARASGAI